MKTKPNPRLRMNAGILSQVESALRHARIETASREIKNLFDANPILRSYFNSWVVAPLERAIGEIKRDHLPAHIATFADDYLRASAGGRLRYCRNEHPSCSPTTRGGCSARLADEYPAFAELIKDAQEAAPPNPCSECTEGIRFASRPRAGRHRGVRYCNCEAGRRAREKARAAA